jgi:exodeoxyribonuclease VII small subunit
MNYEQALQQLQKIVSEIENEAISLDELTEKVKTANELIAFCKTRLRQVEMDILPNEG